jgi:hypothetical protein
LTLLPIATCAATTSHVGGDASREASEAAEEADAAGHVFVAAALGATPLGDSAWVEVGAVQVESSS